MWSNERELEFLECYQRESLLWNPKDVGHKNKQSLHDAWMRISRPMDIPIEELKKKRDSLMATYRGHKRKINASIQSGVAADSVYKPIWFAYDLMDSFLSDITQCRKTINTETQNPATPENVVQTEQAENAGDSNSHSAPSTSSSLSTIPRRRKNPIELQEAKKTMKEAISTLNTVLNKPQVPEDDFDRYGKILANKLRKLSEIDSLKMMYEIDGLFVRRVINNVRPSSTCSLYSEPTQQIENPRPSSSHYVRPASSSTSYSDPGVHMPYSYSDNNDRITIISNEVMSPPTAVDILSQAFYET